MNPEKVDKIVDDIDALVDESLRRGLYCECGDPEECTCDSPSDDGLRCELCQCSWHGLTGDGMIGVRDCPGAYATDDERQMWWAERGRQLARRWVSSVDYSDVISLSGGEVYPHVTDGELYTAAIDYLLYGEVYFVPTDGGLTIIPADRVIHHSDGRIEVTEITVRQRDSSYQYLDLDPQPFERDSRESS